jgi:hypothetical protein
MNPEYQEKPDAFPPAWFPPENTFFAAGFLFDRFTVFYLGATSPNRLGWRAWILIARRVPLVSIRPIGLLNERCIETSDKKTQESLMTNRSSAMKMMMLALAVLAMASACLGQSYWKRTYGGINSERANAITPTPEGNFIVAGHTLPFEAIYYYIWLISIIDDRYAYKDVPFTFKIPVSGDSLNHGYSLLKVPSGMTVSMGGTISWVPKTDSVYMDHAEFLVSDDFGKRDTLTFNIFVNNKDHPLKEADRLSRAGIPHSKNDISVQSLSSKEVRFSLPGGASSLRVYDVRGQLLENLSVKGDLAARPCGRKILCKGDYREEGDREAVCVSEMTSPHLLPSPLGEGSRERTFFNKLFTN